MSTFKKIAALLICLTMIIAVLSSCDVITQGVWDGQGEQELQEDYDFEYENDTEKGSSATKPESSTAKNESSTTKPENSTTKPNNSTSNNNSTEKVEMVWLPASGTKYHSKSTCSGMNSPRNIPLEDAIKEGYTACKRCY